MLSRSPLSGSPSAYERPYDTGGGFGFSGRPFIPQWSALHPLGEHAAVLGVEVGGVVDGRPVERRGGHPVVRRRRTPEEGPKTTATWQHGRRPDAPREPCHLGEGGEGGEKQKERERDISLVSDI